MPQETWASRLRQSPRQAGYTVLTALDAAARKLVVTQYLDWEGQLPAPALETGLLKAVTQYPVVQGWIEDKPGEEILLCWDLHDERHPGFDLSYHVNHTSSRVPSIYSTWELWKAGALPNIEGRMAAAKVTNFPAVNRTLLVISFDHALFDYSALYRFLQVWLQEAAAADTASALTALTDAKVVLKLPKAAAGKPLHDFQIQQPAAAAAAAADPPQRGDMPAWLVATSEDIHQNSPGSCVYSSTEQSRLPCQPDGVFSRSCYFQRPWWTVPRAKADCMAWLQQYQGPDCPFAWHPLDPADTCLQGLKGVWHGSESQFSVWRIPCQLLQNLKTAAKATYPLPPGMWYSASSAAAAVLVATMYWAAPEQAKQHGGLHATTVVDLRGGRCGLVIPSSSMTNASVSGIRVWVPLELLATAAADLKAAVIAGKTGIAGAASTSSELCRLMQHIRLDLHRQLADPTGAINKQFEWLEAARRAGLTHRIGLCQGLLQFDAGDIVLDWLPPAAELPVLPGSKLISSSVRMLSSYMDRIVMAMPVPRADGQPGYDMQMEVSFPTRSTPNLHQAWSRMGLEMVTTPSRRGGYWAPLDGLLYPYSLLLMFKNTVGCLPWLLLRGVKELTRVIDK